jgi:hypothetical protein
MKFHNSILIFILIISSCSSSSDTHRENGKIFHAAPMSGGVGALYFGLYDDGTYQICNSGGLGQECYSGEFKLNKDTLTLVGLNKHVPLKSDKLLILKYSELDSNYWKWKYKGNPNSWERLQWRDTVLAIGDVYQLDDTDRLMNDKTDYHFLIRLDDLKKYK